ncbi:hypothetical protein X975_05292, partial [Stegodyphus mimosarum]
MGGAECRRIDHYSKVLVTPQTKSITLAHHLVGEDIGSALVSDFCVFPDSRTRVITKGLRGCLDFADTLFPARFFHRPKSMRRQTIRGVIQHRQRIIRDVLGGTQLMRGHLTAILGQVDVDDGVRPTFDFQLITVTSMHL